MNTAEKIRLPDDCTVGYIVESVLGVGLIRSSLFHSHLENLQQVAKSELYKQVRTRCSEATNTEDLAELLAQVLSGALFSQGYT